MNAQSWVAKGKIRLSEFSPGDHGGRKKAETKARTDRLTRELADLQQALHANADRALLLIFQGTDASGKDGAIRRVCRYLRPTQLDVANFAVPSPEERAHDFLWRVHHRVPPRGKIGIFNRSHYEGVLVERVLKLTPAKLWRQRYRQIVEFERMLSAHGTVIVKFFLHLSREEQGERFRARLNTPSKRWKFDLADLKNRKRWSQYEDAYEDMLSRTSHAAGYWHIVPADHKWYRDYVVATVVYRTLKAMKLRWPDARSEK